MCSSSKEYKECDEELETVLLQKVHDIIADAILGTKNAPGELYLVFKSIKAAFVSILDPSLENIEKIDEETKIQEKTMRIFVCDASFILIQQVYSQLYHKDLPIPPDVEESVTFIRENMEKTGQPGINPEEMNLFWRDD